MSKNISIQVKNIPTSLKKYKQWAVCKFQTDDALINTGSLNKVGDYQLLTKKPEDWKDFKTCIKFLPQYDGIGFITTKEDPYVFWDFEDCRDVQSGEISNDISFLINKINSYTEISPSGKGIKIIVEGKISPYGRTNKAEKLRVYDSNQFVTITGNHLEGTPTVIKKRTKICEELHQAIFWKHIRQGIKRSSNKDYR